jgi:O-antigen ligase
MNLRIGKLELNNMVQNGYYSYIAALVIVFIMPIHIHFLPPFIVLMSLAWIFENYSKFGILMHNKKAYSLLIVLFVTYYLWEVIGLLYTTDIKMGLSNLFGRLSFVLFPIVLTSPGETIKKKINVLIRLFAVSTFIFILTCFFYAFYRSVHYENGLLTFNSHPQEFFWLNYFYSSELTLDQHPSYVAMYALLASFICFESYFDTTIKFLYRNLWLAIGLLLLITQYYLSSRAGILISLILVPLYFVVKLRQLGKNKYAWILIMLMIIAFVPIVIKNQRVDYLFGRLIQTHADYERKQDPRVIIWKSGLEIAKKNLMLGVGIGDVRTELSSEYKRVGEDQMAIEKFNAHNQFLEVLLENGIIGLILFLAIFGWMFYLAFLDKNLLYLMFICMIIMFFLFETVLYRLAGVSFFSLFSFLLLHSNNNTLKTADSKK